MVTTGKSHYNIHVHVQGFSYLSGVGGQEPVEVGENIIRTIKIGKFDAV